MGKRRQKLKVDHFEPKSAEIFYFLDFLNDSKSLALLKKAKNGQGFFSHFFNSKRPVVQIYKRQKVKKEEGEGSSRHPKKLAKSLSLLRYRVAYTKQTTLYSERKAISSKGHSTSSSGLLDGGSNSQYCKNWKNTVAFLNNVHPKRTILT